MTRSANTAAYVHMKKEQIWGTVSCLPTYTHTLTHTRSALSTLHMHVHTHSKRASGGRCLCLPTHTHTFTRAHTHERRICMYTYASAFFTTSTFAVTSEISSCRLSSGPWNLRAVVSGLWRWCDLVSCAVRMCRLVAPVCRSMCVTHGVALVF